MKFGHVFKQSLRNEGFPAEWVDSAISYSQLKKCINRLTDELRQVGLDPATLSKLLKHVEDYNASTDKDDDQERPFEYILNSGRSTDNAPQSRKAFHPKLLFYVNEKTGEVHSAQLDEETKCRLHMLAVETGLSDMRIFECSGSSLKSMESADHSSPVPTNVPINRPGYRTVEVPITSDTEFFTRLTSEVSGLEKLQEREEKRMNVKIEDLGRQVAKLTDPDHRNNRKMLTAWRQVFQIYVEEGIFFGTTEIDHKAHDSDKAMLRLATFSTKVAQAGLVEKMRKKDNLHALTIFMNINREILQGLRFGEINHSAMLKILKKFDKHTALGVKSTFPRQVQYPEYSEHLAKAVCAEVNTQILSHIPQLDDHSCPMCFEIKWRPVKLRCGHTFCIRCLIVMQNNRQHNCPFCREKTVLDANSDNLDTEQAVFLKKWFPEEVKAKQQYNEYLAGIDQYGEVYASQKCVAI
ncbi:RING-14 protein-like protein [Clathrospora elynae]|uniref:RING-14 protein-like protein n=1 Tax=Clathrospora elynae TaxID=706981 RepID=A0A6A5T3Y5_9PLEO|nr:RING-14 protein-like protein [Clathrospora elynae]